MTGKPEPVAETAAAPELSKLDTLVRRSILRYPLIFPTRWHVLRHLYLVYGNGYEWSGGELVAVFDEEKDEAQCVADFFTDLDALQEQFTGLDDALRRRRRQFILDNLDLLVHEKRHDSGIRFGWEDVAAVSLNYSAAFHVPDDAEESFRAGAVEVLRELASGLSYAHMQGQDGGLHAAASAELERLDPVSPEQREAMRRLLDEIKADAASDGDTS